MIHLSRSESRPREDSLFRFWFSDSEVDRNLVRQTLAKFWRRNYHPGHIVAYVRVRSDPLNIGISKTYVTEDSLVIPDRIRLMPVGIKLFRMIT